MNFFFDEFCVTDIVSFSRPAWESMTLDEQYDAFKRVMYIHRVLFNRELFDVTEDVFCV